MLSEVNITEYCLEESYEYRREQYGEEQRPHLAGHLLSTFKSSPSKCRQGLTCLPKLSLLFSLATMQKRVPSLMLSNGSQPVHLATLL